MDQLIARLKKNNSERDELMSTRDRLEEELRVLHVQHDALLEKEASYEVYICM